YGAVHAAEDLLVEVILCLTLDFQAAQLEPIELAKCVDDVIDLQFDHVNHRAMAETGIGAHKKKQIGEPCSDGALVGFGALRPAVHQVESIATEDDAPWDRVTGGKAGAKDDRVDMPLVAICSDNAITADFRDAL